MVIKRCPSPTLGLVCDEELPHSIEITQACPSSACGISVRAPLHAPFCAPYRTCPERDPRDMTLHRRHSDPLAVHLDSDSESEAGYAQTRRRRRRGEDRSSGRLAASLAGPRGWLPRSRSAAPLLLPRTVGDLPPPAYVRRRDDASGAPPSGSDGAGDPWWRGGVPHRGRRGPVLPLTLDDLDESPTRLPSQRKNETTRACHRAGLRLSRDLPELKIRSDDPDIVILREACGHWGESRNDRSGGGWRGGANPQSPHSSFERSDEGDDPEAPRRSGRTLPRLPRARGIGASKIRGCSHGDEVVGLVPFPRMLALTLAVVVSALFLWRRLGSASSRNRAGHALVRSPSHALLRAAQKKYAELKGLIDSRVDGEEHAELKARLWGVLNTHLQAIQGFRREVQDDSHKEVLRKYGEGPYFVRFTLEFNPLDDDMATEKETGGGTFLVELAPLAAMPHSVHLFLEQVTRGLWDGCSFVMNAGHAVKAAPLAPQSDFGRDMMRPFLDADAAQLSFPEHSKVYPHRKYTLGYAGDPGGPGFFINMEDNSEVHGPDGGQDHHGIEGDGDPCFGRVVSGFETVERLGRTPTEGGAPWMRRPVRIRTATMLQ